MPWVSLGTSGVKPGCSYGRGKFSLARRSVPPRKTKAGTKTARAHYVRDVAAGALLGFALGAAGMWLL